MQEGDSVAVLIALSPQMTRGTVLGSQHDAPSEQATVFIGVGRTAMGEPVQCLPLLSAMPCPITVLSLSCVGAGCRAAELFCHSRTYQAADSAFVLSQAGARCSARAVAWQWK